MSFEIRTAQRQGARLLIQLSGVSGSGKTYTALHLAYGLAGQDANKVVLIDSENRRGSLYADCLVNHATHPTQESFLIGDLYPPFSPQRYIEAIEEFKPTLTVIDEGGLGYGILDRLNEQRYKVRGVNFAWASKTPVMYLNKRAELWGAMRDWVKNAHLPMDRRLKADLTGVQQKMTSSGAIQLESKKDMRARGLASPDAADAIAVTFAFPVARRETVEKVKRPAYYSATPSHSWLGH